MLAALAAVLAAATPGLTVVHDRDERSPLASAGSEREPVAYVREAGGWTQYWLYFRENLQDRGILRTGRHEGDWEMVQVSDREIVVSQHAGAERCPRPRSLVVHAANGSHALYLAPGVRDRTWPDPNDEADGMGPRVRPRLAPIERQPWLRRREPWGRSRARWWVPGEQSSPPGPAFQPQGRWSDPEGWARRARECGAGRCNETGECDGRETAMQGGAAAVLLLLAGAATFRRRHRERPPDRT